MAPPPPASLAMPRGAKVGKGVIVVESRGDEKRCEVVTQCSSYPLRLLAPRAPSASSAWVYAITFGGGILAGDTVSMRLEVRERAALVLATQSSTKVFKAPPGAPPARQSMDASVERGGLLVIAPDAVAAFAHARYEQRQNFNLSAGGSLALVDWVTAGRPHNGEAWAFDSYVSRNSVFVEGELRVADNVELCAGGPTGVAERMGACRAMANVLLVGPRCARAALEALKATKGLTRALLAAAKPSSVLSEAPRGSVPAASTGHAADGAQDEEGGAARSAAVSAAPAPPSVRLFASACEVSGFDGVAVAVRVAAERAEDVQGFVKALLAPLEEQLGRAPYT